MIHFIILLVKRKEEENVIVYLYSDNNNNNDNTNFNNASIHHHRCERARDPPALSSRFSNIAQRHLFKKKIRHFEELSSVASKVKEEEETEEENTNARWRTTRSTLSSAWTR